MKKILIVDDERDICYLLSCMLKGKNYLAQCANTLAEARTALLDHAPFIIFLDINLPDGSGLHFIEFIKNTAPDTKVILMTAYNEVTERKEALLQGADYFMAKPFTHEDIYQVLHRFFPERQRPNS